MINHRKRYVDILCKFLLVTSGYKKNYKSDDGNDSSILLYIIYYILCNHVTSVTKRTIYAWGVFYMFIQFKWLHGLLGYKRRLIMKICNHLKIEWLQKSNKPFTAIDYKRLQIRNDMV
jgi:hypothetical protein